MQRILNICTLNKWHSRSFVNFVRFAPYRGAPFYLYPLKSANHTRMSPTLLAIIIGIVALIAGIVAGKFIFAKDTQKERDEAARIAGEAQLKLQDAERQAKQLIHDAEAKADTYRKQRELEAKERFLQLKAKHEEEVIARNQKIVEGEARIKQQN